MSHFAKVEDGIVTQVIVSEQDFVDTQEGTWVQTSYNTRGGKHYAPNSYTEDGGTPLRKNYAGIGYTYDSSRDAFIAEKPHASWTLNEGTCQWEAPLDYPADGKDVDGNPADGHDYEWDESITNWKVLA